MTAPDGPHRVSPKLQVRLPIRLAEQLHIEAGDFYYWRASDDDPGTLQFIPSEIVERRYSAGERLEAAERKIAQELAPEDRPVRGKGEGDP